jgi:uncharacterized protein (DUF58 family)
MPELKQASHLAEQYRLALPELMTRQQSGDWLGRGTGNSVEYQDHRTYYPGDDVRHIDWRAYARSDRLTLKMYREEMAPAIDLVLDASRSCGVDEAKKNLMTTLMAMLALMAGRAHVHPRLWISGGRVKRLEQIEDLEQTAFEREPSFLESLRQSEFFRRRGVKILISDFLFPHQPADLMSLAAQNSDGLMLIQVLSKFEKGPPYGSDIKLTDAETGEEMDIRLDDATIRAYLRRLLTFQEDLRQQTQRIGGLFSVVDAEMTLAEVTRQLVSDQLLVVA